MRVTLVSSGLNRPNLRRQPWRYLLQVACTLAEGGHHLHLLSDGTPRLPDQDQLAGLPLTNLPSVVDRPFTANPDLARMIDALAPDLVLWHVRPATFLHLSTPRRLSLPVVGLFTSPLHRRAELSRLGIARLVRRWPHIAPHLLSLLVPGLLLRRALPCGPMARRGLLQGLVVQCDTTRRRLIDRGLSPGCVHVIRPGIDPAWFDATPSPAQRAQRRRQLGYDPQDVVAGFLGPPAPLCGLSTLLRAAQIARQQDPAIKLLALSPQPQPAGPLVDQLDAPSWSRLETRFPSRKHLIHTLAACDLVAMPFQLVPHDVPLRLLEAMALSLPVITTRVACLPELVPPGAGLCVPPADAPALARALFILASGSELRRRLGQHARQHALSWMASAQVWDPWRHILNAYA